MIDAEFRHDWDECTDMVREYHLSAREIICRQSLVNSFHEKADMSQVCFSQGGSCAHQGGRPPKFKEPR
jgi:hypothetical protein